MQPVSRVQIQRAGSLHGDPTFAKVGDQSGGHAHVYANLAGRKILAAAGTAIGAYTGFMHCTQIPHTVTSQRSRVNAWRRRFRRTQDWRRRSMLGCSRWLPWQLPVVAALLL